ncbi:LacI family DNA-binding transcriptional regulator [Sediminispirochaeta smaragdinae]|uniref:Transcriptional regulator, LacI family n=1 Tax=Sediminispirochaeta smaragdinae (strain DSM 11293 / JCM 15392 / SEBR 4228) TaxID=573413 RepID=E1R702_SEDSS|nr:LacI family DNA-binding transcriptional regulator [Sediminispirochaeta smaragdinae]ADK81329.1 transcriptional regulator, LacI family [Sediminispirochaeta smaragdinae DSM 11293]
MDRKKRLADVARMVGCSITTVSRVINNNSSVNDRTRQAVEKALQEIGYFEHKKLPERESKKQLIGLIIPNMLAIGIYPFVKGVMEVADLHNFNVITSESNHSVAKETKLCKSMIECGAQGIVFFPCAPHSGECLLQIPKSYPIVVLDRLTKNIPENTVSVLVDHEYNGYLGTKYLMNLGHKNIAVLMGTYNGERSPSQLELLKGYRKAIEEAGLQFREELTIYGTTNIDVTTRAIDEFLSRKIPFSAIFGFNDLLAFGAYNALKKRDIKIPEDISLLGHDSTIFSEVLGMTTIDNRAIEIARFATEALFSLIDKKDLLEITTVSKSSLMIRNSCSRFHGDKVY